MKAGASLRIYADSPEPSLLVYTKFGWRLIFRPKCRPLACRICQYVREVGQSINNQQSTFNVQLDNRHSAQHSMSSQKIDIRLNIQCLARQSTFSSTFNVQLDNQHSAQHSSQQCVRTSEAESWRMLSQTIDIRLNIQCLARQSTFGSTLNVQLDNQHSAQHSSQQCVRTSEAESWRMLSQTIDIRLNIQCLARQSTFGSTLNVQLDNQHSAQHSSQQCVRTSEAESWRMLSQTINIQLNIQCLARQSTFGSTFNVQLDNRHSAQHSMSSQTIDIRLNIQCLARQSTFSSTFNVQLDNQHSAQHSSQQCVRTSEAESWRMLSQTIDIRLNIQCLARQSTFGSTFNVQLDNQHSAQHSSQQCVRTSEAESWRMLSKTINIQLNIQCLARQSTFGSTFNVQLDNRHSAQHSMSSQTIDIRLNIQCLARQSTFSSTFNVQLDNQHSAQHSSQQCVRTSEAESWRMLSQTIDIRLNIQCLARQSTFGSTLNVQLDNQHSAQHSSQQCVRTSEAESWRMLSQTINIQLNIQCLARQSTFGSTFNVQLDNQHSAQHSSQQ